jgi:diguanylate cyclase (GGDEF)-like protein
MPMLRTVPPAPTTTRARIARALARPADPYAGAELRAAQRFALVLWIGAMAACFVIMAFFPPTAQIGGAGWLVAAGLALPPLAGIAWTLRRGPGWISFDTLYVSVWVGLLALATLQWLSGGREAPYHELYLFQAISTALVHPVRRTVPFLVALGVALFAPLVYEPRQGELAAVVSEYGLWLVLAVMLMALMTRVRAQRVQLLEATGRASRLARVDELTGLGNRRAFEEALDVAIAAAVRRAEPLSLVVADLDDFKAVNDAHGHLAGDRVLRAVSAAVVDALRVPDACFRWGGDELAIVLAGADGADALLVTARLEQAVIEHCERPGGGAMRLTTGVAELRPGDLAADLVRRADEQMIGTKAAARG